MSRIQTGFLDYYIWFLILLCSLMPFVFLKASRKDLGSFCAQYGIVMPIPPFQISKKSKPYRDLPYKNKKFKNFKKSKPQKDQKLHKKHKKEVRCFKCGQKSYIAPNCENKVNVLSEKEEEYYSENNSSTSKSDNSQTDSEKEI